METTTEETARAVFARTLAKWKKEHRAQAYRNALGQVSDLSEREYVARVTGSPAAVFAEEGEAFAELVITKDVLAWCSRGTK
jgi:hypothetical protein